MRVAVVDCGSGNLASVVRALARAAQDENIAADVFVTAAPGGLEKADRVVLPGQGAFPTCARGLTERGLAVPLKELLQAGKTPFLGICVGMQLLAERGLEHAETPGLGWIAGEVDALEAPGLRLPHMGWNVLDFVADHPLLHGIAAGAHAYFVHSYGLRGYAPAEVLATVDYGGRVPALVARGSAAGTQFHVEKSQEVGLRILANFLRWQPRGAAS